MDAIIERHKAEKGALISILHAIQDEEGYLPADAMSYLSDKLHTPLGEISRVATYFNKAFKLEPKRRAYGPGLPGHNLSCEEVR